MRGLPPFQDLFRFSNLVVLACSIFISGCSWLGDIAELSRSVGFFASIYPGEIYEGQQSRVSVKLTKPYDEEKVISWSLQNASTRSLASPTEFVEVQGTLSLNGTTQQEFIITSKPGSVLTGSKAFKLILSSEGVTADFDLVVKASDGAGGTISITSADNGGYVNLANRSNYSVGGVCSTNDSDVTLLAEINAESVTSKTTCTNLAWNISLDLSGIISDGAVSLTATHAGTAGGIAATTLQIQKDVVNPTVSLASPAAMSYVNNSSASSFTLSGTCSDLSRVISVTITSSGGGSPIVASGICLNMMGSGAWNATANISALNDGNLTAAVDYSDAAGNHASLSRSFIKDTLLPTLAMTSPLANAVYSAVDYQSLSIAGTCNKAAATITLSGDVSGSLSTTCDGSNFSFSGLTLSGADGVKSILATIADSSGNQSQASLSLQKDTNLPTAVLSGAPNSFSNQANLNVTVGGTNVSQYFFKVGPSGSTDCTNTAGYSSAIGIGTPITSALGSDESKRLCVRGINPSGNTQDITMPTIVTWSKDTVVPIVNFTSPAAAAYVNNAEQASFTISGTCTEVGANNVVIDGDTATPLQVNCVSGSPSTWTANVNFSSASEGPVFLLVAQTDAAGNIGSRTRAFVKDSVNPTIAWTNPAAAAFINNSSKASFSVQGTCSDYSATPNVALTSPALVSTVNVACDGANWNANLAFNNGDESPVVRATITDAAGNTTYSDRSFTKDTNNPMLVITSPTAGSYVNNTNKTSFSVSGTCSDSGTNNIVISGSATATVNCDSGSPNTWSANLDFTSASDGALSITVTHTDAAGNTHAPTLSLNKDVVPPSTEWTLPLESACASNSSGLSFAASGTCTIGDGDVTLSSAQLSGPVTTTCSLGGTWSRTLNLNVTPLADLASFSIQASQTDVAGNSSALSRSFKKATSTPSVILGGWEDVYSVGPKTYSINPSEVTPASEPGQVRIAWKDWPSGNTCQPEFVKIYRASSAGGSGTLVSNTDYPNGIPANIKTFTDNTLQGATLGTVGSPTDFGKGWYYTLKVSIAGVDYNVTSPSEIAEIRVVAPPSNMALVHRWVANQEICGLMSRTTDAANNYRCSYSGWGKITGNYYDLEKDLLVDRGEIGCNFTAQCGAGGNQPCLASIFSTTNPAGAAVAGADGQVFYNDDGLDSQCWIKIAGTWRISNTVTTTVTLPHRLAMTTSVPGKPPLTRIDQPKSNDTCQAYSVTLNQVTGFTTASKRLLRNKEFRAAAAWSPTLTDAQIVTLENGGAVGRCNTSSAHGLIVADRGWVGTYAFYTGSQTATASCQSRYGIQDLVGNVWEWTSDQLGSCSGAGSTCVGVTSAIDPGNTDMNGFPFDHVTAPGSGIVTEWDIESKTYSANYFSIPLGIPLMTNDGGNAISIDSWLTPTNKLHNDRFYLSPVNGHVSRGLMTGGYWSGNARFGRWASGWNNASTYASSSGIGLRCMVPVSY